MNDRSPSPDEFTEQSYRLLLEQLLKGGYAFASFERPPETRHVLWRHDVDFSVHRARALARIEHELGCVGTYFINPRCSYYNVFEPAVGDLIADIAALGHAVGLHFDPAANRILPWSLERLEEAVGRDRALLELACGARISAVSWHNPDTSAILSMDGDMVGGLVNAYGRTLRTAYTYCSDSNGYWRFERMSDVIEAGHERLHLLTHPEWWTPDALTPWERTLRCIEGRAQATLDSHIEILARAGRTIPGKP